MNTIGGTHMTLNDRIKIQAGLEEHRKLKVIAEEIDSDPRTVSKEVKKRRKHIRQTSIRLKVLRESAFVFGASSGCGLCPISAV